MKPKKLYILLILLLAAVITLHFVPVKTISKPRCVNNETHSYRVVLGQYAQFTTDSQDPHYQEIGCSFLSNCHEDAIGIPCPADDKERQQRQPTTLWYK